MSKTGTRRGDNEGSIRERKDGVFEARYVVGKDPITGKTIRKSIYGSSRPEVRRKLRDILTEIDTGTYIEESGNKVKDWFPFWLRVYKWEVPNPIAPTTRDSYENSINKHIIPRFGEDYIENLQSDTIQEWLNHLAKEKRRTAEIALIVMGSALKQAVKTKKIKFNPCDSVSLGEREEPDPEAEEEKALTEDEFSAIWNASLVSEHKAAMLILITEGLRIGEMCPLKEDDVDFDLSILRIRKNTVRVKNIDNDGPGKTKRIVQNKTKTSAGRRVVPMPPITMNAIAEHIAAQKAFLKEQGLIDDMGNRLVNREGYLFLGSDLERPIDKDAFRNRAFSKILKDAGIKRDVTPHMLRHTYNTLLHEAEIDPERRQELCGHADAKSNRIYTHIKLQAKTEAVEKFTELTEEILKRNKEKAEKEARESLHKKAVGDNIIEFKPRK